MKKQFVFLLFLFVQLIGAQELALVKKNGKYGFISKTGEIVIPLRYTEAKSFSNGLAAVKIGTSKWGFINMQGDLVIKNDYTSTKFFNNDVCMVQNAAFKWIYINKKGEILIPPSDEKLYDFEDGVAFFRKADKVGLINNEMKVVLEPKYVIIRSFEKGYARAAVKVNDKVLWGIIDGNGQEVIQPMYEEIGNYRNNLTWARKGDAFGVIKGKDFIKVDGADKIWNFSEQGITYARKKSKLGFIDSDGKWIIDPKMEEAKSFVMDIAPVKIRGNWAFMNVKGEFIIGPTYFDVEEFSKDGLAAVQLENGKWGFISSKGEPVIPYEYQIAPAFRNTGKGFIDGLALVKGKQGWGFIKPNGEVLKEWFDAAEIFSK